MDGFVVQLIELHHYEELVRNRADNRSTRRAEARSEIPVSGPTKVPRNANRELLIFTRSGRAGQSRRSGQDLLNFGF